MNARHFLLPALACAAAMAQTSASDRIKFQAYDGDGRKAQPEKMAFQVIALDAGARSRFVMIGDVIEGTKWRVVKFEFKEVPNPGTGEGTNVSELTLRHTETGRTVVLVLNKVIDTTK
ncbi:MAG: hypothetical protein ABMA13_10380 [Chthoniobacteraceae bacterium]